VPARDAAGIDPAEYGAFHRLRNTLGSLLHQRSDKSDRQLCDWLGHSDPNFSVRRYTGTMDEGLGSADFLDELIPVGGNAGATQHPGTAGKPGISRRRQSQHRSRKRRSAAKDRNR
jgi:hypothetical protein